MDKGDYDDSVFERIRSIEHTIISDTLAVDIARKIESWTSEQRATLLHTL